MNVLPLVCAFILLFSLGSYALVHQFRAVVHEKSVFTGSMRIQRKFASCLQEDIFNEIEEVKQETKTDSSPKNKKDIEYKSRRDRLNPFPESKLNISGFFKEEQLPGLREIAENLLKRIYERTSLWYPNMEREILDLIIQSAKDNPTVTTFEELSKHEPRLYKWVKGTQAYELFTSQGYPSLSDYMSLDPKERKKPIHFTFASRALLLALFGENDLLAQQITHEERLKWEVDHIQRALTKSELEAFLLKHRKNLSDYEHLLYFSTSRRSGPQVVICDEKSNVQLKIRK